MNHSFDVQLACQYGMEGAVLLQNIYFWQKRNKANKKESHYHDGRWWTYNSARAFNELFPYLSERQIQYTLDKLVEKKVLFVGNYNKNAFDRTKWYSVCQEVYDYLDGVTPSNKMYNGGTESVDDVRASILDTDSRTQIKEESSIPLSSKPEFVLGKRPKQDSKKPKKESRWVRAKKPYVSLIVRELSGIGLSKLFYEFLDGVYDKGQLNEQNVIRLIEKVKELYKQDPEKCKRDLNYSWCKRYADIYSEDRDDGEEKKGIPDRPKGLAEMTPEERADFESKIKDMPEY